MSKKIYFNQPYTTGNEIEYILKTFSNGHLSGDGKFTDRCQTWLENKIKCSKALLTQSCTAALEMAAILIEIQAGDEVIMPSFTFASTANAFVLRGGVPVFVDIRSDTLNIDETKIEAAITNKTKAIVVVHYAGVSCEMDSIMEIAKKHDLYVIEDAAQAILSSYKNKPLGSIGHFGALSFHDSKNIISGEGGALLINDANFIERAEIIREKGTNRSKFFRGQVDKYTWVDIGSSYLPSELTAAFLLAQLEQAENIIKTRLMIWNKYHEALSELENVEKIKRPTISRECVHNAHLYYLLFPEITPRKNFIGKLKQADIDAFFHYVPLHDSPAGLKYGRINGDLSNTKKTADTLVRLPIWIGLEEQLDAVIYQILNAI